jgi:type II secretion system protein C
MILSSILSTVSVAQVLLQKAKPVDGHTLGFLIMGTIAQKTPDNNVALIKITSSGQVTAVKIGSIVDNKYKVTDVSEKYIRVVTRDAKHFLVYLDKFAGDFRQAASEAHGPAINPDGNYKEDGFERTNGKVSMTSAYRDRIANHDLSKILMQATAEPVVQSGLIVGFKLYQIDQDSIFAKGGLRDDDIIMSLNGLKLNSVAGAIATLKSLKEASNIEVEILRAGEPKSISISVQ